MPPPFAIRTVLGICPPEYWAGQPYHYIQPIAEAVSGGWFTLSDASKQFTGKQATPSKGVFYADLPECSELVANDIRAWEVQAQSDWHSLGLATEYRALRLANMPYELLQAEVEVAEARAFLTETGVPGSPSRRDDVALVQFRDGWVMKIRLQPPVQSGRWLAANGVFATPVEAWQSFQGTKVLTVASNGKPKKFLNTDALPPDSQWLDLATWDEVFEGVRSGGIGSVGGASASELKHAREKIELLLRSFPGSWWQARREKIQTFLDAAGPAAIAKQEFTGFLSRHPAFAAAVEAGAKQQTGALTYQLRSELLQKEKDLAARLGDLERQVADKSKELEGRVSEYDIFDQMVKGREADHTDVMERVGTLTLQEELLKPSIEEHRILAGELAELSQRRADGEGKVAELETEFERLISKNLTATEERDRLQAEIVTLKAATKAGPFDPVVRIDKAPAAVKSATDGIDLVRKNLENVGMNGAMALNIAIESFVATGGGQIILVRGSLAAILAEILALSFGETLRRFPVALGASDPIQVAVTQEPSAILLDGANLSCPDVYGLPLQRLVQKRMISYDVSRFPVVVATILNGPSSLPLPPSLAALGACFDTDLLGWTLRPPKAATVPGRFGAAAFQVAEGDAKSESVLGSFKNLAGPPSALWEASARMALRRLAGVATVVAATQPEASFVAAWLLPWMVANQVALADVKDDVRAMMTTERAKGDPRVLRMLGMSPGDAE